MTTSPPVDLIESFIVDKIGVGVFVIDRDWTITLWNRFMATHSGLSPEQVIGQNLFTTFPELETVWLKKKLEGVFLLGNYAFTTSKQHPYLFVFAHNRPITGTVEHMQQDCTFLPIKDEQGQVSHICIAIFDATDAAMYRVLMQEALHKQEEISIRDALTGLYNRGYTEQALHTAVANALRHDRPLSVIMTDIDFFKKVNDNYGHATGDEVLIEVAQRFEKTIRTADIVGRYGGEEFVFVLPETNGIQAEKLAERLRKEISREPIQGKDCSISVSISLGVNTLRTEIEDHETLLDEADKALYLAKSSGRNQVVSYLPNLGLSQTMSHPMVDHYSR